MRLAQRLTTEVKLARLALGMWGLRQWLAALTAAVVFGGLLGVSTVLIPNSVFTREIEAVWWNYPVWIITSVAMGMLIATYVRTGPAPAVDNSDDPDAVRSGRAGIVGGFLAWFAVGCPVCNKIALVVLGYSGALTWFAPLQPVLALSSLVLSLGALVWRLRGQIACTLRGARTAVRRERASSAR